MEFVERLSSPGTWEIIVPKLGQRRNLGFVTPAAGLISLHNDFLLESTLEMVLHGFRMLKKGIHDADECDADGQRSRIFTVRYADIAQAASVV